MPNTEAIRILVLAVLFAPVLFAACVGLAGRSGYRTARRIASLGALLHLGLTIGLTIPSALVLMDRADQEGHGMRAASQFQPIFVPGDPERDGGSYETAWNLFPVGTADPALPPPAIQFFVGIDGLNIWLVLLTSVLTYVSVLVSHGSIRERAGGYYAWLFLLQTAIIGAFLSFDVVLFYIFFELTLIPAFFLIGCWGTGGGRRDAARKFFLYTLLGSLFTLIGIFGIVLTNPTPVSATAAKPQYTISTDAKGQPIFPKAGPVSFSVNRLMRNVSMWNKIHDGKLSAATARLAAAAKADEKARGGKDSLAAKLAADGLAQAERDAAAVKSERDSYKHFQFWLFFALIAGFVVKVPLVPFHTWLPAAYSEAPAAVTLIFSGVLAKLGTLGLVRIVLPLCPDAAVDQGMVVFGFLGALGIVYAAFCAYAQRDLKLLAAYSSISHLGLLVLGTFTLSAEGITGAALHMVNHGLTAGTMFALIGFLAERYRTTDMNLYGGLIGRFPQYAFLMFVICLAGVGLPGLNNFISEMLLLSALFAPETAHVLGTGFGIAAASGIFLSAWYTMTMLRKVFFGPLNLPPQPTDAEPRDLHSHEWIAFGLPALLCLVLGVFPQPVIRSMKADVNVIVKQTDEARERVNAEKTLNR
jgi:NADH-quinone oxidoreductase subunit M